MRFVVASVVAAAGDDVRTQLMMTSVNAEWFAQSLYSRCQYDRSTGRAVTSSACLSTATDLWFI